MTRSQANVSVNLCRVLVESYAVNERMNQIVLDHLDPAAWHAKLPGSKGRTIPAIVTHVHNMRRKWLKAVRPTSKDSTFTRPHSLHPEAGPRRSA